MLNVQISSTAAKDFVISLITKIRAVQIRDVMKVGAQDPFALLDGRGPLWLIHQSRYATAFQQCKVYLNMHSALTKAPTKKL